MGFLSSANCFVVSMMAQSYESSINQITYSLILNANVLLGLEGDGAKLEELRVKSEIGKLKHFLEVER